MISTKLIEGKSNCVLSLHFSLVKMERMSHAILFSPFRRQQLCCHPFTHSPPANRVVKVMFSVVCLSVCLFTRRALVMPPVCTGLQPLRRHCTGLDPPVMFKLVHCVPHTGKQAVGIQLKCLLVVLILL